MEKEPWGKRLKHAWNAFVSDDAEKRKSYNQQYSSYYGTWNAGRPDRPSIHSAFDKTILSSIYTRLAIDISGVPFRHVRLDDQGRYVDDIDSQLNQCLTVEANIDQAPRAFMIDVVLSLFTKGCIAIVPTDTTEDPNVTGGFDVKTMRVGPIIDWAPQHARVEIWREEKQRREQIVLPKKFIGIVENPLYAVMNEPNSTLQRLVRKLNLLDVVDEQSASGKLDLIVQLPYVVRSESRRQQAQQRREDIEDQLKNSSHGIAYTDGTEKIVQLNRPAENNLMAQIEYLIAMLYAQLGLTPEIMNGTADEATMLNYKSRTLEPVLDAIQQEYRRKFLTRTARTQMQSIMYFYNLFKLMPLSQLAEIFDKMARNEIASSNELRQLIGWKPHKDPKADQLVNSNMSASEQALANGVNAPTDPNAPQTADPNAPPPPGGDPLDQIDQAITDTFQSLGITENVTQPA